MKPPLLSIIIPVYNSEKYISRCLNTVTNLLNNNIEVIVVDDGSTDKSLKICKKYCNSYSNVFLFEKTNEGVSSARNYGIKNARGVYVTFIDSDDWIDYTKYDEVIRLLEDNKYDLISYNMVNVGKKSSKIYFKNLGACENFICFPVYMNSVCNKVFRRELLNSYNILFDENIKLSEDLLFVLKCYLNTREIFYLNENIYYYRDNIKSATHNIEWDELIKNEKIINCIIERIVKENNYYNEYKNYIIHRNTYLAMYYILIPSVYSTDVFRKINNNKAEWYNKKEIMHCLLCFTANHHLDFVNDIYIKTKSNKLFF